MKKNSLYILFVCCVILGAACSQDNELQTDVDNLPVAARLFIDQHFPTNTYLNVVQLDQPDKSGKKYNVLLTGDITIDFESSGYWTSVRSETDLSRMMLSNVLGIDELDALVKKYPHAVVQEVALTMYGKRIGLDTGEKLACCGLSSLGIDLTDIPEKLPEKATTFLNMFFDGFTSSYIIQYENTLGEKTYKVSLEDEYVICFDQAGRWYNVQSSKKQPLPEALYQTLPPALIDFVSKKYPQLTRIYGISMHPSHVLLKDEKGNQIRF